MTPAQPPSEPQRQLQPPMPSLTLLPISTSKAPAEMSSLWLVTAAATQEEERQGSNVFLNPRGSSNSNDNVPAVAMVAIL
ncbi:hypothetical protein ACA910_001566 [Epithemia clementina (nom. ined.)]